MSNEKPSSTVLSSETTQTPTDEANPQPSREIRRRSFLKGLGVTGAAALSASALLGTRAGAEEGSGSLTKGDASILRFLAAAEIIESDIWLQYQELAGTQDDEVSKLASKLIPGYPPAPTGGNPIYIQDLVPLDGDMSQYIHDNTEDELTHEVFINAYLKSKGADTVNMDHFRVLPSSKATGANQFGRITNLMQLTVDTSWWTRYRSRTKNPDFGDTTAQAIPTLAVGQHTAIPRTDADTNDADFIQAVANTAGFHFAWIEQGGSSLYPVLAHFQTWQDKAGNAPQLTDVIDPVTGVSVTFPDLNSPPLGGEDFQTNLIMPEPTVFLSKKLPACSIIRPTATNGAAMGALQSLTADGLFIGQSKAFFTFLRDLAENADAARRIP